MKESSEELKQAIIIVSEAVGIKDSIDALLSAQGIYSTIKMLTYYLFVENYNQYFEKNENIFESVSLIRTYCKEMQLNGEVNFDSK